MIANILIEGDSATNVGGGVRLGPRNLSAAFPLSLRKGHP